MKDMFGSMTHSAGSSSTSNSESIVYNIYIITSVISLADIKSGILTLGYKKKTNKE
jgi:hypothetical protein